jgi:hypothetical protein
MGQGAITRVSGSCQRCETFTHKSDLVIFHCMAGSSKLRSRTQLLSPPPVAIAWGKKRQAPTPEHSPSPSATESETAEEEQHQLPSSEEDLSPRTRQCHAKLNSYYKYVRTISSYPSNCLLCFRHHERNKKKAKDRMKKLHADRAADPSKKPDKPSPDTAAENQKASQAASARYGEKCVLSGLLFESVLIAPRHVEKVHKRAREYMKAKKDRMKAAATAAARVEEEEVVVVGEEEDAETEGQDLEEGTEKFSEPAGSQDHDDVHIQEQLSIIDEEDRLPSLLLHFHGHFSSPLTPLSRDNSAIFDPTLLDTPLASCMPENLNITGSPIPEFNNGFWGGAVFGRSPQHAK